MTQAEEIDLCEKRQREVLADIAANPNLPAFIATMDYEEWEVEKMLIQAEPASSQVAASENPTQL